MTCSNRNCDRYLQCHDHARRVFEALQQDAAWLQTQYKLCEISYKQNVSWGIRSQTSYRHTPFWKEKNRNEHTIEQG